MLFNHIREVVRVYFGFRVVSKYGKSFIYVL